jgi:hypothetical protein
MSALSTQQMIAEGKHKEEEKKTKSSPKWPKAKENPKLGHLKWTKLVPKDMGNSSMQPSKTQLALKKRQQAQHH